MTKDRELYQSLIEPIEDRMIAIVMRVMQDHHDAQDVFQEVLAVIWKKLKTLDRHPNPHAYILRICVTRSYDALRIKAKRRREVRLERDVEASRQDSQAETMEMAQILRQAIALLPRKQGQAVFLRLIEGEDYMAIAAILNCSPNTARSHFHKGKTGLRSLLQDLGVGPERNLS
ncbi:MAG: RNA polymerase sigma factor [Planctomycetes bacterium]|nr:RNA polymerase sigma factor [Planctomycetota bacterium]